MDTSANALQQRSKSLAPTLRKLYVVLIEWDGETPPSTWYRRLDELVGSVRGTGNKSQSPLSRRARDGGGVTFQEGCILCASESLAITLANYVQHEIAPQMREEGKRSPTVQYGEIALHSNWDMDPESEAVIKNIHRILSKRGKPPEVTRYAVTCYEECETFAVERPLGRVINCPHCGGVNIAVREGYVPAFKDDGSDIYEFWKRSRFSLGRWEWSRITSSAIDAPSFDPSLNRAHEGDVLQMLDNSHDLLAIVRSEAATSGRGIALEMLDAVFVGRSRHLPEKRNTARVQAVAKYFAMGGNAYNVMVLESPEPDVFDTALIMGDERAAQLGLNYVHNEAF